MQRRSNVATGIVFILAMVLCVLTVSTARGQTLSIAQARQQGACTVEPCPVVSVQGWVTVPSCIFQSFSFDCGFAIQDNSAGIYVSVDVDLGLALDQKAQVTGSLQDSFGLLILRTDPDNVTAISSNKLIAPQEFNTCQIGEDTEGRLVRVVGNVTHLTGSDCGPGMKLTQTICDDTPYGYRVFIDGLCNGPGPSRLQVFIALGTNIIDPSDPNNLEVFHVSNQIEVTGFSGQFDDHYEVNPRFPADIQPAP
jgi:hypothetical protein